MGQGVGTVNFGKRAVCPAALEAYIEAVRTPRRDRQWIRDAEEPLRALAGADGTAVFSFLGSGAEAIHQVLFSLFWEVARKEGKCHMIVSCLEDAATFAMLKRLEELGCVVHIAPVTKQGQVDVEALARLINPRTALVSVSYAEELTGVIQPLEEIAALCRDKKVRLHIEGSGAIGKIGCHFAEWGIDYLTFSGSAIDSVESSAALFAKEGAPLVPWIFGRESDVPSLLAFSRAAQQALLFLDTVSLECARLRDLFERTLQEKLPDVELLFREQMRLPTSSLIRFPKIHQEMLLYRLQRQKMDALMGGGVRQKLSALLMMAGFSVADAESALAFTLSRYTIQEEVERAVVVLVNGVTALRSLTEEL